ncbi:VOC family protein [Arthrobacter sp. NPDC089319]|uniref:VOC family protein n=1 Tax=Arthrobacter sp. NPDC089319 TaxID=3155915 RepID=UPI00342B833C
MLTLKEIAVLRVRPVVFTSRIDPWRELLAAAGLVCSADDGGAWLEFDAASGRLGLRRVEPGDPSDGRVQLGFEVRDLDEFVRRTATDGTQAAIEDADRGRTARITAPSGFSFLAEPASPSFGSHPGPEQPDPALAVMPVWGTPDVPGAVATLRGIGAHPRFGAAGEWADFAAKNGGLVAVRHGAAEQLELSFEYDDDLTALRDRLAEAGAAGSLADGAAGAAGQTLLVDHPDGAGPAAPGRLRFTVRPDALSRPADVD